MKKSTIIIAVLGLVLSSSAYADVVFAKTAKKRPSFAECDKNGDGTLSHEEFTACYPHSAKKFAEIDANGDGQVTKEEAKAFHAAKKAAVDTNKDGSVSKEEAKAHRAKKATSPKHNQ